MVAIFGIHHGHKERAGGGPFSGSEFRQSALYSHCLQVGELQGQSLSFARNVEKPLAAIAGPGALFHVILVDERREYAAERLLRDAENIQQIRDVDARIAVDEVQDPMVGATERERFQHMIGFGDKVPIGEKQQLDQVPGGFRLAILRDIPRRAGRLLRTVGQICSRMRETRENYVSHIDILL